MIYTCQKGIISYIMMQLAIVRRALVHIIHDILAFGYVTPKVSIGSSWGACFGIGWDAVFFSGTQVTNID